MDYGVTLGQFLPIAEWNPQIGDIVIYHGWIQHWFGVVNGILRESASVSLIKDGLPMLLLTKSPSRYEKDTKTIGIDIIQNSRGGKYAIQRARDGSIIWYI